ncbi:MAG TPA: glutamate formimidoyltransferase, partial [Syntrophales bacterium]|nr:glutamate formimidoyltransferase [Syntrophales bacterium]
MKILECVPNFSEGRDPDKVRAVAAAVTAVPGVRLLDCSWDADHNRSVLTFLGAPADVCRAALAAAGKALEIIDLGRHDGVHPRIGAVDVVPFVPLGDAEMADAVFWAHHFGTDLAARHHVPVFFYGEAALNPACRELSEIRRGGLPGLMARLREGSWLPDAGPRTCVESIGATAVGARMPLLAYNINLKTPDIALAKRIAGKIREAGGGLPGRDSPSVASSRRFSARIAFRPGAERNSGRASALV